LPACSSSALPACNCAAVRSMSWPACSTTLPAPCTVVPTWLTVLVRWWLRASAVVSRDWPVASVVRLTLPAAAIRMMPSTPALTICAACSVTSPPASTVSTPRPPGLVTYSPATRSTCVMPYWWNPPPSSVCVLLATVMSPPACTLSASVAVTVLPMTLMSCVACRPTACPPIAPPCRLWMLLALMLTNCRPAMLPVFTRSPRRFSCTFAPASSAPVSSRSPGRSRRYTCGTSTVCLLPSARATAWPPRRTTPPVRLRHQHRLRAAVGQGEGLLHQPHDAAGQLRHLLGAQRHARAQAVLLREQRAGLHQGAVLVFVRGVAGEEAAAGEFADLVADQALRGVAVAQATVRRGPVIAQRIEHVVRAQPVAVVGKARVGLDQVSTAVGADGEQAGRGQAGIKGGGDDDVG